VRGIELKASRQSFVRAYPESVVAGVARTLAESNVLHRSVGQNRTAGRQSRERPDLAKGGVKKRLIEVSREPQVCSLRAKVSNHYSESWPDLALNIQVPRLNVGVVEGRIGRAW